MTLMTTLRDALRKRAAYRHTLRELRALSPRLAEDAGLFPTGAERIAHAAIYG